MLRGFTKYGSLPSMRFMTSRMKASSVPETMSSTKLFEALSRLNQMGVDVPALPSVVVVGQQSSGKSSVLEAFCGEDILPKKMDLGTQKPTMMTCIRSNDRRYRVGDIETTDLQVVRDEINRLNSNTSVEQISVTIWSPDVYNSTLGDLPGLTAFDETDPDRPTRFMELSQKALKNDNNIIAVVLNATQDAATSMALRLVHEEQRATDSIGVITKLDLTDNQNTQVVENMLAGTRYPLGHGYVGVVCRNKKEVDAGMTVQQKVEWEEDFLDERPQFKPAGVPDMRLMISDIQLSRIYAKLPEISASVESEIKKRQQSGNFFSNLANDTSKSLPRHLTRIVERLVGSSDERAELEYGLHAELRKEVEGHIAAAIDPNTEYPVEMVESMNSNLRLYLNENRVTPNDYQGNDFADMFGFGSVSPIVVSNDTITRAFDKEQIIAASMDAFHFVVDEHSARNRARWYRDLRRFFARMLTNDEMVNQVYKITRGQIMTYIQEDPDGADDVALKFAEYIVDEIGSRAYADNIRYSVEAQINLEKRPKVNPTELSRNLVKIYQESFNFNEGFWDQMYDRKKIVVPVYGPAWTHAYLRTVGANIGENTYRNVAVNLLDRFVEKLMEMTIDMFNQENVEKEKKKIQSEIRYLNDLKAIIMKAQQKPRREGTTLSDVLMEDSYTRHAGSW